MQVTSPSCRTAETAEICRTGSLEAATTMSRCIFIVMYEYSRVAGEAERIPRSPRFDQPPLWMHSSWCGRRAAVELPVRPHATLRRLTLHTAAVSALLGSKLQASKPSAEKAGSAAWQIGPLLSLNCPRSSGKIVAAAPLSLGSAALERSARRQGSHHAALASASPCPATASAVCTRKPWLVKHLVLRL